MISQLFTTSNWNTVLNLFIADAHSQQTISPTTKKTLKSGHFLVRQSLGRPALPRAIHPPGAASPRECDHTIFPRKKAARPKPLLLVSGSLVPLRCGSQTSLSSTPTCRPRESETLARVLRRRHRLRSRRGHPSPRARHGRRAQADRALGKKPPLLPPARIRISLGACVLLGSSPPHEPAPTRSWVRRRTARPCPARLRIQFPNLPSPPPSPVRCTANALHLANNKHLPAAT
jgi:hypothetical protein